LVIIKHIPMPKLVLIVKHYINSVGIEIPFNYLRIIKQHSKYIIRLIYQQV